MRNRFNWLLNLEVNEGGRTVRPRGGRAGEIETNSDEVHTEGCAVKRNPTVQALGGVCGSVEVEFLRVGIGRQPLRGLTGKPVRDLRCVVA